LLGINNQIFTANWPNLLDLDSVQTNVNQFGALNNFQNITASAFSLGLQQLGNYLASMASSDNLPGGNFLKKKLPLVNKSLSELIDFPTFFHDALTGATNARMDASLPFSNAGELLDVLLHLPGVNSAATGVQVTADDLRYTLRLDTPLTRTLPFDLGTGSPLKLKLNGDVMFALNIHITLTFGVNKSDGRFFIWSRPRASGTCAETARPAVPPPSRRPD